MKLMHLSDLHLGKRVNEFSMLEDQKYILDRIIDIAAAEKPGAILIAGDVYDKSVPSAEAVELFDYFLVGISALNISVFVISGNHDSPERIAFGGRIMEKSGVYVSPVYDGKVQPVSLADEHGRIDFWMLPFVKPAHVRRAFPEAKIESYTDAIGVAIENMPIDSSVRNVLITHQFVTGATRSESEEVSVGGTDNVDASVFDIFDYVALGHIHGPQNIGSPRIRYCGTPLKYSFSEAKHVKSISMVTLGEKGNMKVAAIPLIPLRDMQEIKGSYEELTLRSFYEGTSYRTDYMHITLTDEEDIPDAVGKLRVVYKNLMKLSYDNRRTRMNTEIDAAENAEQKSPLQLFAELYEKQNNAPMSAEQECFMAELIEKIWEAGK